MKAGDKVRVEFELVLPADATEQQVDDWIRFELNLHGSLSLSNPLDQYEIEASWIDVLS